MLALRLVLVGLLASACAATAVVKRPLVPQAVCTEQMRGQLWLYPEGGYSTENQTRYAVGIDNPKTAKDAFGHQSRFLVSEDNQRPSRWAFVHCNSTYLGTRNGYETFGQLRKVLASGKVSKHCAAAKTYNTTIAARGKQLLYNIAECSNDDSSQILSTFALRPAAGLYYGGPDRYVLRFSGVRLSDVYASEDYFIFREFDAKQNATVAKLYWEPKGNNRRAAPGYSKLVDIVFIADV